MRKYKALQTWCQSTTATYTSLPREVGIKLVNFALNQWREFQAKFRSSCRYISGEELEFHLPIKVNGVQYILKAINISYKCESISIYYTGRGRKIRIADHWCDKPVIIGHRINKYGKSVPVFKPAPNRGTAVGADRLRWISSTGYTYVYLEGPDNSFVVNDETINIGAYEWNRWHIGKRVFEGGWVPLKDIKITRGPNK